MTTFTIKALFKGGIKVAKKTFQKVTKREAKRKILEEIWKKGEEKKEEEKVQTTPQNMQPAKEEENTMANKKPNDGKNAEAGFNLLAERFVGSTCSMMDCFSQEQSTGSVQPDEQEEEKFMGTDDTYLHDAEKQIDEIFDLIEKMEKTGKAETAISHLSEKKMSIFKSALSTKTAKVARKYILEYRDKASKEGKMSSVSEFQMAGIVIESVILVTQLSGTAIPENDKEMTKAVEIVQQALRHPSSVADKVKLLHFDKNDIHPDQVQEMLKFVFDLLEEELFWSLFDILFSHQSLDEQLLNAKTILTFSSVIISMNSIGCISKLVKELVEPASFLEYIQKLTSADKM